MAPRPIKLAILGATGRMGTRVKELAKRGDSGFSIVGRWSGGEGLSEILQLAEVAIDFTPPDATSAIVEACSGTSCALVSGTTGRSAADEAAIAELGEGCAVFVASNMSPVVALLSQLIEHAARALPEFDIEISETHHSGKRDAPSGTAITLGGAASRGRGEVLGDVAIRGDGPRSAGDIGFSVRRGGNVIGDHEIAFFGPHEQLTLCHRAQDRDLFAAGALKAATWLVEQSPGVYGMQDLLRQAV